MKIDQINQGEEIELSSTSLVHDGTVSPTFDSEQPVVSIVISNYNYADYVGQAIESALSQTYQNIEVIIVDDGSTDASAEVIDSFSRNSRLRILHQANAGQAAAMNRGFEMSTGEVVLFLDSDDFLHHEAASTIVANWTSGISQIQFPLELVDGGGMQVGLHPFSRHMEDGDIHWQIVVGGHFRFMPTSGNAFYRKALSRIMPILEKEWRICADTYIAMMSPKFGPVKNLGTALGSYRVHGLNNWYTEARSTEKFRAIWQNHIRTWRTLIRHIEVQPDAIGGTAIRRIRDAAALYQWRRVIVGQHRHPDSFTAPDRRKAKWEALRELAKARMPLRHKLLYLGFVLAMAAGAYERASSRGWVNHHLGRPRILRSLVDWAKGDDFYGWMRARKRAPGPFPEIPLNRQLRFGRQGSARAFQGYGWTHSDLYADWCIGAEAALVAAVPSTTETLILELDIEPKLCERVTEQRLVVLANDYAAYRGSHKARTKLQIEIPCEAWLGKADLVIRLVTPDFFVPRFLMEDSEDHRPLSFGFYSMQWSLLSQTNGQQLWSPPYLPLGPWMSIEEEGGYTLDGWSRSPDGLLRINRIVARLAATVLEPSGGDHLISFEFERESSRDESLMKVQSLAGKPALIDLSRQRRLDLLLPRGSVPRSGQITVAFRPNGVTGGKSRGFEVAGAAGPGLRRMRLRQIDYVARRPLFQPDQQLDFRVGGSGKPYLAAGWHAPEEVGTKSSDLVAAVTGVWADNDREAFITVLVRPASTMGPLATPMVRIIGNGEVLANYTIDGPAELTAIVPVGLIEDNRLLRLEFETDSLLRPSLYGDETEKRLVGLVLQSLVVS